MPRNGNGVYTAPAGSFNPATSGASATPTDWNATRADYETALSNSIAVDGQTTITANLPMAGFKHTGVANAAARTDYAATGQVQDGTLTTAADTGAANAYALTLAPAITAYLVGQVFRFVVVNANTTTTPTLAINALTAGLIKWANGAAIPIGALPAGAAVEVIVAAVAAGTPTFHLQTVAVPALTLTGGALTGALNEARGAAIASAATTDIGAATGNFLHITGTVTITALGTVQAGTRRVVIFDGALILTHNATSLILPTGANITTAAGDAATFESEGAGNWRCVSYSPASGVAFAIAPFTGLQAANGYIAFPGGTILQWGKTAAIGTGGATTVTLPVAFSSACYAAYITGGNSSGSLGDNTSYVDTLTTTQIAVHNLSAGTMAFYWFAVGK